MTKHIVANLAGNWVDLTEAENVVMGPHKTSPYIWIEESALLNSGKKAPDATPIDPVYDSYYNEPYVMISYAGADYRVSPALIQVVTK